MEKDIICDCCGESCEVFSALVDNPINDDFGKIRKSFEYMVLKANWGYFSDSDGESWEANVCEKCVKEKLSFINFKKKHYFI